MGAADKAAKDRDDRQNYLAAAMVTSLGASCHLKKMQKAGWGSGSKPAVETQGTDAYLGLVLEFQLVHFSENLTLAQRVESASYCINLLRFWRNFVHCTPI